MREMTARQRQVLDFMRSFTERHGVPPAVREIAERFGFTARAAFDHLKALERKGMLERRVTDKRASRTLVAAGAPPERPLRPGRDPHPRAHRRRRADLRRGEPRGQHPAAAGLARRPRARTSSR